MLEPHVKRTDLKNCPINKMFLQTAVLYLTANNDPESLEDVLRWAKKIIRMKTETRSQENLLQMGERSRAGG